MEKKIISYTGPSQEETAKIELMVFDIPSGKNRTTRDELIALAGENRITFDSIDEDSIVAILSGEGVTESLLRKIEDAGWEW